MLTLLIKYILHWTVVGEKKIPTMSSKEKVVVVNTTSMVVFNSKKKSSLIENVANCGKTVIRLFLWSL